MNEVVIKLIGNYSYQTTHCLGQGVYGKVYQGMQRDTKQKVAIKKVDLATFNNDKYLQNAIFSEIYLLKRFNHPNIVKFKDVLSSKNSLYIITEFCKNGDLKQMIKRKRFKEDEAFDVIRQIICGFAQLVHERIVHRDLKPANILIHDGVFKIADFGFAKYVDNFGSQMLKSCVGSPIYMAPQLLERTPYTTKCDIWSIGIIFYEMLFGSPPWKARDENQLMRNVKGIPISTIIKKEPLSLRASEFLKKTLAYSEEDRVSWGELFEMFGVKQDKVPDEMVSTTNSSAVRGVRVLTTGSCAVSTPSTRPTNQIPTITVTKGNSTYVTQPPPEQKPQPPQPNTPTSTYSQQPQPQSQLPPSSRPPPNGLHTDSLKRHRQQLAFKFFVCTQLFTNFQSFLEYFPESFKLDRLLFLLISSIKMRGSYSVGMLTHNIKQGKQYEELHAKMVKEQETYDEMERDVQEHLECEQNLRRIKEDLMANLGNKFEIINQDRILKIERNKQRDSLELLQEALIEAVAMLLSELRRHTLLSKDIWVIQVLEWLTDVINMFLSKDRPVEISLMARTEDSDANQYFARVSSKVQRTLSCC